MSFFPRKVLLATDGSREAGLAARAAAELAGKTGSALHLVYVLPAALHPPYPHFFQRERVESEMEKLREEARGFLERQRERLEAVGAKVEEAHLREGRADEEIVRLAEELGAGLIVVGSRGLTSLRRALMGSVSDSVVRHAHCPVLVVREDGGG
ncbi:Putative universal stress protein [Rubrobacter xylanophilus DSM 9941]|uniref:universal stress protein n=1 Tax=Rubrobacter xylanophilus TaxID=49319 RepID=UPI001C63C7BE|nr:universal stress protein [Rubrobacter xylanophilus]QYJ15653.1 Putative universal stress protein [Rubrobacter xylanophilus DSM 9941]